MATKWLHRAVAIAGLWALTTTGASALTLQITSGGLSASNLNYGCPTGSSNCSLSRDYQLSGLAPATGTIVINDPGTIATISLSIAGATFDPLGIGSPIVFGPTTYSATLSGGSLSTTPIGPGTGGIDYGFGTGSVTGSADAVGFAVSPSVNITCAYPGGTGTCGITFSGAAFSGIAGHQWSHTFNVSVAAVPLPEPATALLIALAAAGLLIRSRAD